jgi:hypothetical protein
MNELYECKHCKNQVTAQDSFETNSGYNCCISCADSGDLCECLDSVPERELPNGDDVCQNCYEHMSEKAYDYFEDK